jgi:hypothetical protein
MSLVFSNGTSNKPATLISPVIQLASSSCVIKFWLFNYHLTSYIEVATYKNGIKENSIHKNQIIDSNVFWTSEIIYLGN